MEATELTARARIAGPDGNQEADPTVAMKSKPLHRFVHREPKSLGIVILIFGCAELLMGFHLASESARNSCEIYIPFWQGALFVVCGNLSIYTGIHPSKKMVTVCLALYVVSLLGTIVSVGYRISCFGELGFLKYRASFGTEWTMHRVDLILGIEGMLFVSSLCVATLLIFLSTTARLALKSNHPQVIVQCVPAPAQSDPASD